MTETLDTPGGLVAAGVDGSDSSLIALRWAAADAVRRRARLRVLIARPPAADYPHDDAQHVAHLEAELNQRAATVASAAEQVLADAPDLQAETSVVVGNASFVLLDASRTADLLVIGSRGLGGWRGALAGSTGPQLAGHTGCPLVVVRDLPAERTGVVVVGVDGSTSDAAVEYAVAHAERIGGSVRAVTCWDTDRSGTVFDLELPLPDGEARYRTTLDRQLTAVRERHPSVPIAAVPAYGRAAEVLAEQADDADLLVVGSRGRGGFATLVLGSVALTVLHEVHRPVAVVPSAR